jgi:hypothetical protein
MSQFAPQDTLDNDSLRNHDGYMKRDGKFSIALHILAHLSELGGRPTTSEGLAALSWPCAPLHPVIDPSRSGEKFGGTWLLGRPPNLTAKAKGDKSMVGKRARSEGAYGRGSRDPRDMVKARLPEPQSPVMQGHVPRSAPEAGPPG